MNTQFKRGVLELCVMKVISKQKLSAFEIIDLISHEIDVNENTVYPILRRLTNDKYFSTEKKRGEIGAPRKYYSLTKKGEDYLFELEETWFNFINGVRNIMEGKHEN
ncbi:MAG: PadR family transcriptional regulator [Candidatus Izimaplasma sp.]|nr:PadR family transcriptional regulator [Candidatus Izimaplasma bacterium]